MKDRNIPKVAIVLFPWASTPPYIFSSTVIKIVNSITNYIYIITGNKERLTINSELTFLNIPVSVHYVNTRNPLWISYILWICKFILIQLYLCFNLVKIFKKVDTVIFMSYPFDLLPLFIAKIFRKKVVISAMGSPSLSYLKGHEKSLLSNFVYKILVTLENISFSFSDLILVQSESVVDFLGLADYGSKIRISGDFIDVNLFKIEKRIEERNNLIGYVGRLFEGKGVMELIEAVPIILDELNDVEFLIGGTGPLEKKINTEVVKKKLSNKVELSGWIPSDEFVNYLNEIKLYVFPSDSEGVPIGILEAMACGTPVLATPVGGIPDVIKDGETGFIMENNSPECIAMNVIRALRHPDLNKIINNARAEIENKFKFDRVVENYINFLVD